MTKELIIMRGCPSSGKSYLAKEIAGEKGVFSADDYHIDPETGDYNWKPNNVKTAHEWNHNRVSEAIGQGMPVIAIDNTHIKEWELKALKPLVKKAIENGYSVRIEEPNSSWYHWETAFNAEALFERNKETHNVPLEAIKRMVDNFKAGVTVEDILKE